MNRPKPPVGTHVQVLRFATIGLAGTGAYLLVYLLLRDELSAHAANATSRVLVAVPTTWANARLTFASRVGAVRVLAGAGAALLAGSVISTVPLAVEQSVAGPTHPSVEVATLAVTTVVTTVIRFVLLRRWLSPARTPISDVARRGATSILPPPSPSAHEPVPKGKHHVHYSNVL